ncbi:MAG: helix-turn-helix domain-containing protein [Solirubrobacteraceae bacterium]
MAPQPLAASDVAKPGQTVAPPKPDRTAGMVGPALRTLRLARNLTIAEASKATDISASFLSLVENNKSDITIGRVTRLVQFYGASLTDLLPAGHGADADIVRAGEGRNLHSPEEGMDIFMLTPDNDRTMVPMLLEFEPGGGRKDYGKHAGEEFVYVIEGELLLELEGREPRRLKAGDSAYYPGDCPHLWSNASTRSVLRVLCVDSSRLL